MTRSETQKPTARAVAFQIQQDVFTRFSSEATRITGSRWAFIVALGAVVFWAATGPYFQYSETWQLVINTGTTIVTFLMVFLIQGAQNRESKAIHLKLDELLMALKHARNELIDIERLTDRQLDSLAGRYHHEAERNESKLSECFPVEQTGEV